MKVKVHISLDASVTPDQVAALIRDGGLSDVNLRRLSALGVVTASIERERIAALESQPGVVSVTEDATYEL